MDHLTLRGELDAFLTGALDNGLHRRWREQGFVDRAFWSAFAQAGFLGVSIPARYGGGGGDFRHEVTIIEGLMNHRAAGLSAPLHSAVVAPYIVAYAREDKRREWLAKAVSGETILAIAMTEPGAGSDLQAIRTTAVREDGGYRINGQKTFISNGLVADLVLVACKTDRAAGAKGVSIIAVETTRPGFERGRLLDKIGQHARDTSELFFRDVWVPEENLLGEEGRGFAMLMEKLPQERMVIACQALAMMEMAVSGTRTAFPASPGYALAEAVTETRIARTFVDNCVERLLAGELDTSTASMAKYWTTEAQARVLDKCLGLFEAHGFAGANPIADLHRDARAYRLYGGTTEIMKTIIARPML